MAREDESAGFFCERQRSDARGAREVAISEDCASRLQCQSTTLHAACGLWVMKRKKPQAQHSVGSCRCQPCRCRFCKACIVTSCQFDAIQPGHACTLRALCLLAPSCLTLSRCGFYSFLASLCRWGVAEEVSLNASQNVIRGLRENISMLLRPLRRVVEADRTLKVLSDVVRGS